MAKNRSAKSAAVMKPANRAVASERKATRTIQRIGSAVRSAFGFTSDSIFGAARTLYEAAARHPRIPNVSDSGPNSHLGEIERVRARSRHAVRNNPLAKHALWVLTSNVVGYGIKPLTPYTDLQELFEDWARETGFYRKQALVFMTFVMSGEGFVRFRDRKDGDMETVPLDLQIMEPDHFPIHNTGRLPSGNHVLASIEEDLLGRVTAFHGYAQHPSDYTGRVHDFVTHRIPASEMLHVYLEERPGMRRGMPMLAAALNKLDSLDLYDDAELERKKGASMFGGFYTRPLDAEGDIPEAFGTDDEAVLFQHVQPNTWMELPVGYTVTPNTPPAGDANYPSFRREQLSAVAVSLHMTYEHLTWNFEKLGDRQYRAAMLEFVRLVEMWQYHVMNDLMNERVWKRFVRTAILTERWTPPAGARPRDYLRAQWTPPARGYVHPVQDIQAYAEAIRAGITSRKRVAGQLGEDVRQIDIENAQDQEAATQLKLRYSTYVGQDADHSLAPMRDTAASAKMAQVIAAETEEEVARFAEAEAA